MKQNVSKQMDGGLNANQIAVSIQIMSSAQDLLYSYSEGVTIGEILEVKSK